MSQRGQPTLRELQHRAELALEAGRRAEIERTLIELAHAAPVGSDAALFAHRHLAELHLEDNPWRAALHLRRAIDAGHPRNGDVLHALMGLCQALLGNYGYAARCYRRALRFAPGTPWYHHNLGHLLDIGLDDLEAAEHHLRIAYEQEPLHDEVVASLAHCLARRGNLPEALVLAREAVSLAPRHKEHRSLKEWIEQGAPAKRPRTATRVMGRVGGASSTNAEPECDASGYEDDFSESVAALLVDQMIADGFDPDDITCARDVLDDYIGLRDAVGRPDVLAAAVEYTVSQLRGLGRSQQNIAARYGVTRHAVGHRSRDIRTALSLRPDSR